MYRTIAIAALATSIALPALAQELPSFMRNSLPERMAADYAGAYGKLTGGDGAALDRKTQELVALAVAAQIPCDYCVYAHQKMARLAGASEEEVREAVLMAGVVRLFSTQFNGMALDLAQFKSEHDRIAPPGEASNAAAVGQ